MTRGRPDIMQRAFHINKVHGHCFAHVLVKTRVVTVLPKAGRNELHAIGPFGHLYRYARHRARRTT